MRISRIELRHVALALTAPFATSMGVRTNIEHVIVRVDVDGVTGWGECVADAHPYYSSETTRTTWHILRDCLVPAVLGQEVTRVEEALALTAWVRGHRMAKAGLEAALWDALAKAAGVSLSTALGGVRERIEVGVSIGIQPTPADLVRQVARYLGEGYRRIKIKIAPGRDLADVKAVRAAIPGVRLQVDANSAYTLDDMSLFRALDEENVALIEQPLSHDDIFDHSKVQRELRTAICLDESIHSVAHARAALDLQSCRVINIKPGRVGGFTESRRIHDLCASRGVPVWHGGMLETGIGRAGNVALASLPNFELPGDISASRRYYREEIVEPAFEVAADGTMGVPVGAGIGVEVVVSQLDKVTVGRQEFRA
jgi:o-succinylbenzoate synthase